MHILLIVLLALLLLYYLLSLLLFIAPQIVHTKRQTFLKQRFSSKSKLASFSHRGGAAENFENSISAFKHSLQLGLTGIELDVHVTRDKKIVVTHDSSLHRTTGQSSYVRDINYEQIGPYMNEVNSTFCIYRHNQEVVTEKPPLLEDLFELVRNTNVLISIDIKTNSEEDLRAVCDLAKQFGLLDRIIIGTVRDVINVDRLRVDYGPQINFFFPAFVAFKTFLLLLVGALPFVPIKHDCFFVTYPFKTITQQPIFKTKLLLKVFAVVMRFIWPLTTLMNWHLKKRGVVVVYWTLNCEEDYEFAIKLGTQGLMGDIPSDIKRYLKARNLF